MTVPATCTTCRSSDPNMVGVLPTGADCRDPFHCPSPDLHGNPFRYCPHCTWAEQPTPDTERGLYGKYRVQRVDGQDKGPYFVLAYASDPHARVALAAYIESCRADYGPLAADLTAELAKYNA